MWLSWFVTRCRNDAFWAHVNIEVVLSVLLLLRGSPHVLEKMSRTRGGEVQLPREVMHGAEASDRRPENFSGFLSLDYIHSGHGSGKVKFQARPNSGIEKEEKKSPDYMKAVANAADPFPWGSCGYMVTICPAH